VYHDYGGKVEVSNEEIPMTLHVALVGTDGIVLASDKKIGIRNTNPFRSFEASKLCLDFERGRVACWAGDDPAITAAKNILASDSDEPTHLQLEMESVFKDAEQTINGFGLNGEVILLTTKNPKKIEYFQRRNKACSTYTSTNKMLSGDNTNPATSFIELFYRENLTVKELIPLAAHTVLTAGRHSPAGIGGLEIIVCTAEKLEYYVSAT
jgi:hypothetical protein